MTSFVTSADGTRIAFDRLGRGAPVILISGMFCHRPMTQSLAEQLAEHFTVINYDRRGRGESTDTAPYAVEREIEDLAALIDAVGGSASVYGHSSGAALALRAAAARLPTTRLVLHEPPYGADDDASRRHARELAENVRAALAAGRRADAIELFLGAMGMPPEMRKQTSSQPGMRAVAPTMVYDHEVMRDYDRDGIVPEDLVRTINVPTLVVAGSASPEFFRDTAIRLVELLPNGRLTMIEGADHGAPANVIAPVVAEFLSALSPQVV